MMYITSSSNYKIKKLYLNVYKFSMISAAAVFALQIIATLDTQQKGWNTFVYI